MIIPEFMRFYNYSLASVLDMPAITFFSLSNSMASLQARESLIGIMEVATGFAGKQASSTISSLEKQAKGISGIVEETKIIKGIKGR